MSKLPATSVGSPPAQADPAEATAPVEEHAETAGQRLWRAGRRLGRRLRPGPQPVFLLLFLGLSMWMFAPAWSSPTTTTLAGGDGDPAIWGCRCCWCWPSSGSGGARRRWCGSAWP